MCRSCFLFNRLNIQKLYAITKTPHTSVTEEVTMSVILAVLENVPCCTPYALVSVDMTPARELRKPGLRRREI